MREAGEMRAENVKEGGVRGARVEEEGELELSSWRLVSSSRLA